MFEMNVKRRTFVFGTMCLLSVLTLSVALFGNKTELFNGILASENPYSIVFETSKNKLAVGAINPAGYSGSGVATTELGNEVAFDYSLLINPTSNWQTIKAGGYITNTQPIMGMSSISLTKSSTTGHFGIYWSNTKSFTSERYALFDTSSPLSVTTDFAGYMPNYIKIVAIANSSIVSGVIEFSCADSYDLSYNVFVASENLEMGTVSGSGQYAYDTSVTITATPEMGYSFLGWYNGASRVSTQSTYTFSMPNNALNYVAKFSTNNYSIALTSEDTNKGTVTGAGTYPYKQSRTITATPKTGYSFVGWYDGETLVSSNNPFTFAMPYNNLSYVAKFSTNSYVLTLTSNNISKGTVSESGTYLYREEVTAIATEISGNEFIGWYQSSTLKSTSLIYTFTMPYNNLSLEARFVTQYNVDISSISDSSMGTVSGGGAHGYTTSVTIKALPASGNWFVAWYDDSFNIVSENASYTFTMPEYDVTYYAEFSATQPIIKGGTYYFGTYPQSKVTNTTLLSTLNSVSGTLPNSANSQAWTDYGYYISDSVSSYMWYIDIENSGNEYRGVYFTSYRPYYTGATSSTSNSYQHNNGYNTSSVYWFKYEPITWRVLDVQSNRAFLMADLVLDSQDYHYSTSNRTIGGSTVYANNYKESHIRSWLNDNFYNTAFTAAEKARIQTTTVDNSVASTGYSSNTYACANTSDKVFLLSYAEATSATYGLSTDASRQLQPSAYAQSQGVYTYTNGKSYWWLRSPSNYRATYARYVGNDGNVDYSSDVDHIRDVPRTGYGVLPALWISL